MANGEKNKMTEQENTCPFCQVREIVSRAMAEIESVPEFGAALYDDAIAEAFNKLDDTKSLFMCYCKEGQP
jgi:protein tyrosine phosphatase (PTP) superfamily phosphohydrolase (DUF442 family)